MQDVICLLIRKTQNFSKDIYKGKESYNLKMLIPKSYVTKLIGSKGCMIQEIANDSGGATIKILSTKKSEEERELPEIIVSIAGNIGPMQDAACIIVEQMEIFKNGGPVLSTGKAISQNIVSQFKNSIKFTGNF